MRIVLGWQDRAQAEFTFTKQGLEQILACGAFLWASGIREPGFCQDLQKQMGSQGVEDLNFNERSQRPGPMADLTYGLTHRSKHLMSDIRTELGNDEALVLFESMQPLIVKKPPYFEHKLFSKRAAKSPYYEERSHE